MLLGTDGEVRALVDGPLDDPDGFHPTAQADSVNPWVAYATRRGITITVTVHDLAANRDVASTTIDCPGCTDFAIDAFDDGVAYVRIDQLTRSWDSVTGQGKTVYDGGGPRRRRAGRRHALRREAAGGPRPDPGEGAGRRHPHLRRQVRPRLVEPAAVHRRRARTWSSTRARPNGRRSASGPSTPTGRCSSPGRTGRRLPALPRLRLRGAHRCVRGARSAGDPERRPGVHRRRR